MADPAYDLRDLIVADSSLGFVAGTNCFLGPIRAVSENVPVQALFINARATNAPTRLMSQSTEIRSVMVETHLRWNRYYAGRVKLVAVMNYLLGQTPSGYLDTYVISSEPMHSGTEEGHHLFHMNVVMRYEQAAA